MSKRPPSAPRPFNIRLWFGGASLIVILAIALAFGVSMSRFLTERLLEREAESSQEFLQSVIRAERTGAIVFAPTTAAGREALQSFTSHIVSMPGILRANIYTPDRRIVWSTDAQLVGRRFEVNRELDEALRGRRVTEVGTLSAEHAKSEHVSLAAVVPGSHFVEAYIPMRDESGAVLGVVEFYKSPATLHEMIERGRTMIWVWAISGGLLLYATLFWIVRRGAREIERQRGELAEMEALAAVGQMAGAIAHSLRNPLASIRSSSELIQATTGAETRAMTADIIADVERMDRHVRELLRYARNDSVALQVVDPAEVAATCLAGARPMLDRQRVEGAVNDRRAARAQIEADPVLLGQALTSVVTNAIEAMPEGGRLDIDVESDPGRAVVRLAVRDTGRGMAPETLAQVAKPFFTTKTRGLGLGLVLAKRIVERFAGRFAIDSEVGRGTRVVFEFAARG